MYVISGRINSVVGSYRLLPKIQGAHTHTILYLVNKFEMENSPLLPKYSKGDRERILSISGEDSWTCQVWDETIML